MFFELYGLWLQYGSPCASRNTSSLLVFDACAEFVVAFARHRLDQLALAYQCVYNIHSKQYTIAIDNTLLYDMCVDMIAYERNHSMKLFQVDDHASANTIAFA